MGGASFVAMYLFRDPSPLGMNAFGHGIEVLTSPLNLRFESRVHLESDPYSGSLEIQLPPSDSKHRFRFFPPWGHGPPGSGEGLIRTQILICLRGGHDFGCPYLGLAVP